MIRSSSSLNIELKTKHEANDAKVVIRPALAPEEPCSADIPVYAATSNVVVTGMRH